MNLRRGFDILALRLRSLVRRSRVERDLERELAAHLAWQVEENIGKGMAPEEARAAARRSLGGIAQIQEECRDMRRTEQLETIWNDLRYAVRVLGRAPAFTVAIVLTLALCIGANSAIFSVVEGVLLRPLPFPHADRLVRIFFKADAFPKFPLNPFDLRDFRARNRTFEGLAGIVRSDTQLSGAGEPVMLRAFSVTAGYFRVLGFSPARGRDFSTADETPAMRNQAILSDHLWRSRFTADPAIVGRSIMLDSRPYTVVGIMPPNVRHPGNDYHALADGDTVDLWLPFTYDGNSNQRGSHFMEGIGRLKPGVTPARANADLSAVLRQLISEHITGKGWQVYLVPLYREMVGRTERMLLVLLCAVGLLLLIACVNAANLLLARSSARVREMAVRCALGAGRARIVRQLLTESLVLALSGAALGALLAAGGVRLLVFFLPADFPRATEIHLNSSVFLFTLTAGVITGLLFGLVPAFTASRTDLQSNLREGGRNATGGALHLRIRNFLVVGETALACVLLIAAGLMLHSFVNLVRSDPGFRPQRVLTASLSLPEEHYRKVEDARRFYDGLLAKLEALPGVEWAGVGSDLPWTGYDENAGGFAVEGRPAEFNNKTSARYHMASANYFRAVGIPLLSGRFFNPHDDKDAPRVILINEAMAKAYWPGEDAVGRRITFEDHPVEKDWMRIVGVVGDVKDRPDSSAAKAAFWWPLAQMPFVSDMSVAIRSTAPPAALTGELRAALHQLDPDLALADLRLMDRIAYASVSSQRFALFLIALFAGLALLLATIGIYGVISYSVSRRMPEFGMRVALGAKPWDLTRLIVGQGLKLSVAGAAAGLLCAAAAVRLMGALLYEVTGSDPVTFAAVAVLALGTSMVACYLPARRAATTDPMCSLRSE